MVHDVGKNPVDINSSQITAFKGYKKSGYKRTGKPKKPVPLGRAGLRRRKKGRNWNAKFGVIGSGNLNPW